MRKEEDNKLGLSVGQGASFRASNIQRIIEAIERGMSDTEILDNGEMYFKATTLREYIRVAHRILDSKMKPKVEPPLEGKPSAKEVKRRQKAFLGKGKKQSFEKETQEALKEAEKRE